MNLKCASTTLNKIGITIRNERTKANLTLSELEKLSGVTKGVISKLENGETKHPNFQTIYALCHALKIDYKNMVNLYISVETRAKILLPILQQCSSKTPSSCEKIAKLILQDDEDSQKSINELFVIINTITDRAIQLNLYKLIISHTRLLGMQVHYAKALYESYLIERDNFERLKKTYHTGKFIVDYANFLSQEERKIFYYKLGNHAYHLTKYEEAIAYLEKSENLNDKKTELKAWTYLLCSSCYYHIEKFDVAFAYLKLAETYPFPFVKETIQFITGALNIKTGNTNIGVEQLQHCLIHTTYKINAVNILFNAYLKIEKWDAIKKLITQEDNFLNPQLIYPDNIEEHAEYYANKSKYYDYQNYFDEHIECLFKSINLYAKIGMNEKIISYLELTHNKHLTIEQHNKVKTLFKEFRKKYNKEVPK